MSGFGVGQAVSRSRGEPHFSRELVLRERALKWNLDWTSTWCHEGVALRIGGPCCIKVVSECMFLITLGALKIWKSTPTFALVWTSTLPIDPLRSALSFPKLPEDVSKEVIPVLKIG